MIDHFLKSEQQRAIGFKINSGYSNKSTSEEDLWKKFKEGSESAFIQIYRTYVHQLYHFGCQFSASEELVKDCLQDFFIYLRKTRSNLSNTDSIRLYLFKSFKRRILEYKKQHQKMLERQQDCSSTVFPVELSPEEAMINQQLTQTQILNLNNALKTISAKEREAVYYFYYENLSYQEIAKMMNFSHVSSARRLIYNALKHLRIQLN
jgi:RNA polymerase sigma-70 factor (ECF subfamily)